MIRCVYTPAVSFSIAFSLSYRFLTWGIPVPVVMSHELLISVMEGMSRTTCGRCFHLNPICLGFDPLERLCGALEDARSDAGFFISFFFLSNAGSGLLPF